MLIAAGTMLEGKYRIERLLGAGGMGSVWIAEHTLLGRPVAVKVLDTSAARNDATAVTRFLREAQTAARLRSDHIVDVLDVGRFEDGTPFLVMELLEGETLSNRIRRAGRLSFREAAELVDQLLAGLAEAHGAGVIHRDIKPDNCFLTRKNGRDHLKLLDFGISKVASEDREKRMTRTGVVMGTPYYMAPEQARGAREIDHRCDLYAAGAILYECVTGRVPFDAESVNELLFKIVLEPLVPPRAFVPELDPAFEQVVLRAMAREASARFQSAPEFRAALAPFLGRAPAPITLVQPSTEPSSGTEPTTAPNAPGSPTPSGLQGLSATGPLHLSDAPASKPRGRALLAAMAVVLVAMGFGVVYLASSRASLATNDAAAAHGSRPTTTPPSPPPPSAATSASIEPTEPQPVQPEPAAVDPPRPSTSTSNATAVKAAIPVKKSSGTNAKTAQPKAVATSPPPAPQPIPLPPSPATAKPGAPRPIDTVL